MQRGDQQEWAEAYIKEYQGFIEQGTLKIAWPEKGAEVLDTTTRADYKLMNGVARSDCVSATTSRSKVFITNLEICMLQA
jgi:hypothetical protein